jgi:hypothetical protein
LYSIRRIDAGGTGGASASGRINDPARMALLEREMDCNEEFRTVRSATPHHVISCCALARTQISLHIIVQCITPLQFVTEMLDTLRFEVTAAPVAARFTKRRGAAAAAAAAVSTAAAFRKDVDDDDDDDDDNDDVGDVDDDDSDGGT